MAKFIIAFQELRRRARYWYYRFWSIRWCKKHGFFRTMELERADHTGKQRFCVMCVVESMVQPIRRRVAEASV
jgi:hypothetical protein